MTQRPVLMICPYPPKRDGIGTYSHHLAVAVSRHRPVVVATQRGFGIPPDDRGVRVVPVLSNSPATAARLFRLVLDRRPEAVHLQFSVPTYGLQGGWVLLAMFTLRIWGGTRLVVTLHEVNRELALLRGVARLLFRFISAIADRIVVHNSLSRDLLVTQCRTASEQVTVLPHGVPEPFAAHTPTVQAAGNVLYFGYLHPDKGIEHLIDAAAILRDRALPCRVTIAGAVRPRQGVFRFFERKDVRYAAALRRQVRVLGLATIVEFSGYLSNEQLARSLQSARVVVLPYVNATQSGVANRVLAAGRPIVASRIPGLTGDLGDCASWVPPANPLALADALTTVLSDDTVAATLAEATRNRSTELALDSVALDLVALYGDAAMTSTITVGPE